MTQRNFNSLLAGWLLAILPALSAGSAAAQWGDLKVNFKVDGKPERAAGKHTFMFWQENTGYVSSNGMLKTLKGKAELEIENGKVTDLGTVLVKHKAQ